MKVISNLSSGPSFYTMGAASLQCSVLGRVCAVLTRTQPSRGAADCCIDVQHSMFFAPLDFLASRLAELPFSGHPVSAS